VTTRDHERYLDEALAIADRINGAFRSRDRDSAEPITVLVSDSPRRTEPYRAVAGMLVADAVLVNPMIDGLNLVSKEVPIASQRNPVVILSRNAGAFEELQHGVLAVDPADIEGTARAIEEAFEMSAEGRARRASNLRATISARTSDDWLLDQLDPSGER
jgi:trehalose 6-phosphate synthase